MPLFFFPFLSLINCYFASLFVSSCSCYYLLNFSFLSFDLPSLQVFQCWFSTVLEQISQAGICFLYVGRYCVLTVAVLYQNKLIRSLSFLLEGFLFAGFVSCWGFFGLFFLVCQFDFCLFICGLIFCLLVLLCFSQIYMSLMCG